MCCLYAPLPIFHHMCKWMIWLSAVLDTLSKMLLCCPLLQCCLAVGGMHPRSSASLYATLSVCAYELASSFCIPWGYKPNIVLLPPTFHYFFVKWACHTIAGTNFTRYIPGSHYTTANIYTMWFTIPLWFIALFWSSCDPIRKQLGWCSFIYHNI